MNKPFVIAFALIAAASTPVLAVPQVFFIPDSGNTIPGTKSYSLMVDGDGLNWTAAAFKLDLTQGSVYNGEPDSMKPQELLWPYVPDLEWDTWFGVPGDPTNGIAGGAGDVGGGPLNVGGTGVDAISISWFNITSTDRSLMRIANVTLSDDAVGSWSLFVTFFTNPDQPLIDGTILDTTGTVLDLPEPASLTLLSVGLLGLIRRR